MNERQSHLPQQGKHTPKVGWRKGDWRKAEGKRGCCGGVMGKQGRPQGGPACLRAKPAPGDKSKRRRKEVAKSNRARSVARNEWSCRPTTCADAPRESPPGGPENGGKCGWEPDTGATNSPFEPAKSPSALGATNAGARATAPQTHWENKNGLVPRPKGSTATAAPPRQTHRRSREFRRPGRGHEHKAQDKSVAPQRQLH